MASYISFPKELIDRVAWDGNHSAKANTRTTEFQSGKTRVFRINSWAPVEYPGCELVLNNVTKTNGTTEYERFNYWATISLRDCVLPFIFKKIGSSDGETAVYEFMDSSVEYEEDGDVVTASFGLREFLV